MYSGIRSLLTSLATELEEFLFPEQADTFPLGPIRGKALTAPTSLLLSSLEENKTWRQDRVPWKDNLE